MIRTLPWLPAGTARPRRHTRRRRQRASTNTATAAPTGAKERPPPADSPDGREADGREADARRDSIASAAARLLCTRTRAPFRSGRACTRGAGCPRLRDETGSPRSRKARTGGELLSPSARPWVACNGASVGTAARTVALGRAGKAAATPVVASGGCGRACSGAGVGIVPAGLEGTTCGAGATDGVSCSPVAGGPTGAISVGRSSSGSRYPFGSALRRTPR